MDSHQSPPGQTEAFLLGDDTSASGMVDINTKVLPDQLRFDGNAPPSKGPLNFPPYRLRRGQ
jgi:hypothetical protein